MTDRRIEYLTLASLKPHPRNPKDHDIGEICRSITRFGFNDAVIIDERTSRLVSGHGRVEALRALAKEWRPTEGGKLPEGIKLQAGEWCVPVQRGWASRDETEAEAFIVAANRLVEIGGYNDENLEAILRDLAAANALDGVGFDRDDVDRLINEAQRAALGATDPDEVPDVGEVTVKPGDLYALGEHRLLCGDSTFSADVERALAGVKADGTWTDPPYGVSYESKAGKVHNDGADGLEALLEKVFTEVQRVLKPGGFLYVAHPAGANSLVFFRVVAKLFTFRQGLAWVKDSLVLGHADYHYMHEPIIYAMKAAESGRRGRGGSGWYGDNAQTSVFAFPKPKRSADHPTMKPVELVEAMLKNSSAPGHVIFEPFSGSGTTLMACERLQRKCRAIELDPVYVQRTIARWEAYTGLKASKL